MSGEQSAEAERAGRSEASVFSCERKSEETAEDNLLCDRPPLVCNGICIRPNYLFSDKSFNYLSSSIPKSCAKLISGLKVTQMDK